MTSFAEAMAAPPTATLFPQPLRSAPLNMLPLPPMLSRRDAAVVASLSSTALSATAASRDAASAVLFNHLDLLRAANEDLSLLLKKSHGAFWSLCCFDRSIAAFLASFAAHYHTYVAAEQELQQELLLRQQQQSPESAASAGGGGGLTPLLRQLCRRTLMVLLRLSYPSDREAYSALAVTTITHATEPSPLSRAAHLAALAKHALLPPSLLPGLLLCCYPADPLLLAPVAAAALRAHPRAAVALKASLLAAVTAAASVTAVGTGAAVGAEAAALTAATAAAEVIAALCEAAPGPAAALFLPCAAAAAAARAAGKVAAADSVGAVLAHFCDRTLPRLVPRVCAANTSSNTNTGSPSNASVAVPATAAAARAHPRGVPAVRASVRALSALLTQQVAALNPALTAAPAVSAAATVQQGAKPLSAVPEGENDADAGADADTEADLALAAVAATASAAAVAAAVSASAGASAGRGPVEEEDDNAGTGADLEAEIAKAEADVATAIATLRSNRGHSPAAAATAAAAEAWPRLCHLLLTVTAAVDNSSVSAASKSSPVSVGNVLTPAVLPLPLSGRGLTALPPVGAANDSTSASASASASEPSEGSVGALLFFVDKRARVLFSLDALLTLSESAAEAADSTTATAAAAFARSVCGADAVAALFSRASDALDLALDRHDAAVVALVARRQLDRANSKNNGKKSKGSQAGSGAESKDPADMAARVASVQALMPDYGDAFAAAALRCFGFDPERTVNAVFEGALPPALAAVADTKNWIPPVAAAAAAAAVSSGRSSSSSVKRGDSAVSATASAGELAGASAKSLADASPTDPAFIKAFTAYLDRTGRVPKAAPRAPAAAPLLATAEAQAAHKAASLRALAALERDELAREALSRASTGTRLEDSALALSQTARVLSGARQTFIGEAAVTGEAAKDLARLQRALDQTKREREDALKQSKSGGGGGMLDDGDDDGVAAAAAARVRRSEERQYEDEYDDGLDGYYSFKLDSTGLLEELDTGATIAPAGGDGLDAGDAQQHQQRGRGAVGGGRGGGRVAAQAQAQGQSSSQPQQQQQQQRTSSLNPNAAPVRRGGGGRVGGGGGGGGGLNPRGGDRGDREHHQGQPQQPQQQQQQQQHRSENNRGRGHGGDKSGGGGGNRGKGGNDGTTKGNGQGARNRTNADGEYVGKKERSSGWHTSGGAR